MFGMTVKDADTLGSGLRVCKKLRIVKIANSKLDDDRFYAVYDGLKNLSNLGNGIYIRHKSLLKYCKLFFIRNDIQPVYKYN